MEVASAKKAATSAKHDLDAAKDALVTAQALRDMKRAEEDSVLQQFTAAQQGAAHLQSTGVHTIGNVFASFEVLLQLRTAQVCSFSSVAFEPIVVVDERHVWA
jgi:hypothetical protein